MSLSARKIAVHAKLESVYGTLATLVAADSIATKGAEIMPFEGETVSRDLDRAEFGSDQEIHIGTHQKLKYMVELVGSGTLGTAPKWGPLLIACGMKEVIVPGVSVEYTPNSGSLASLTKAFNLAGQNHLLSGARGTYKIKFTSQQIPYLELDFTGLWNNPASAAAIARLLTGWIQPDPVTFQDTPTIEFYGVTTGWVFKDFVFDMGNKLEYHNNPGEESVEINDRESKGSVELLAPPLSIFNAYTQAKANAIGALKIVHGTVASRRVIIESPSVQLLKPKYGNDKDRTLIQADLNFIPTSSGDDEIRIRLAAA